MGTVIRELGLKICLCHLPFLWCGGSFWAYLVLSFPHLAVGDVQGGMDWDTHFPPGSVPWRYRGYLLDSPGESSIVFSNNFPTTEKNFLELGETGESLKSTHLGSVSWKDPRTHKSVVSRPQFCLFHSSAGHWEEKSGQSFPDYVQLRGEGQKL